jgi:hypothetical protein
MEHKRCFGNNRCWNQVKIKCVEARLCELESFLRKATLEQLLKVVSKSNAEKIISLRQANKVKYLSEELE